MEAALAQYAPDGKHLASTYNRIVTVRDAASMRTIKKGVRSFPEDIEALSWSPDSSMLLVSTPKQQCCHIISIASPEWFCCLKEGVAGLAGALWAPDSRHVLTASDFNLHLSVWSLSAGSLWRVRQPKTIPSCLSFAPGKEAPLLALATRRDCKDYLGIYGDTGDDGGWGYLREWPTTTIDLQAVEWSPTGAAICVVDSCLEYRVQVYSPDGTLLGRYIAYDNALGVKTVQWSPSGSFLAVGSYDQSVRLLTNNKWSSVAELSHIHPRRQGQTKGSPVAVFQWEVPADTVASFTPNDNNSIRPLMEKASSIVGAKGQRRQGLSVKENGGSGVIKKNAAKTAPDEKMVFVTMLPDVIPVEQPDAVRPELHQGVGLLAWCASSRFLASRCDTSPRLLWLWDTEHLRLVGAILFARSITRLRWSPCVGKELVLAVATGANRVYLIRPSSRCSVTCVNVPSIEDTAKVKRVIGSAAAPFTVTDFRWHPEGKRMLLMNRRKSMIAVNVPETEIEQPETAEETIVTTEESANEQRCEDHRFIPLETTDS